MRHYTTRTGTPLTPAHHTGRRVVRATAKLRDHDPDVVLAFGSDGRLFYGDSPEDYAGAQELSCRNCARFALAERLDRESDASITGDTAAPIGDHEPCPEWERRS